MDTATVRVQNRVSGNSQSKKGAKPMMKAGIETGSLMNHIYSTPTEQAPEVGMGATVLCWTDRHAGTIIKVTPAQIHVQHDIATRVDKNGMSESQQYEYAPDPNGRVDVFRMTKRGWRNTSGNGLAIGIRQQYYDFSF